MRQNAVGPVSRVSGSVPPPRAVSHREGVGLWGGNKPLKSGVGLAVGLEGSSWDPYLGPGSADSGLRIWALEGQERELGPSGLVWALTLTEGAGQRKALKVEGGVVQVGKEGTQTLGPGSAVAGAVGEALGPWVGDSGQGTAQRLRNGSCDSAEDLTQPWARGSR